MKFFTVLTLLFLLISPVYAQTSDATKNEIYPKNYSFEKAEEFQKAGEYEKALWFYINLFPDNTTKVVELVQTLALELDTVDMGKLIKKSFAQYGTFDPAVTTFHDGVPMMNMGKLKLKGSWGDRLIQKISDPSQAMGSASEYNFRGLDKVNVGDFKGAILDFDTAIQIEPTDQVYYNRAYSKSEVRDFEGAIQDYDVAIAHQYRLAEAYYESGFCNDQMGNSQAAIDNYTKAIEIDKDYADAYNNRAFTKLKLQDYKDAIKDFSKAIQISPDYAGAYLNRGYAKNQLGKKSSACKDWEKALSLGLQGAQQFLNDHCK